MSGLMLLLQYVRVGDLSRCGVGLEFVEWTPYYCIRKGMWGSGRRTD